MIHQNAHKFTLLIIILLAGATSCGPSTERTGVHSDKQSLNTSGSVDTGFGRVLKDNPIILSGNPNLPKGTNLNSFLPNEQSFITLNSTLKDTCGQGLLYANPCVESFSDANKTPLAPIDGRWSFDANSTDFLQVQSFYYAKKSIERYQTILWNTYSKFYPSRPYGTSLPSDLYTLKAHWSPSQALKMYASCSSIGNNASFNPTTFSVCLGYDPKIENFYWSQDKDVIDHETHHAIIQMAMNLRNRNPLINTIGLETNLGILYYDEAGCLGEAIADYGSYMLGGGRHFAEWAAGRFFHASRPLTENDPMHIAAVNTSEDSRLSYPQYINYDPNTPTVPIEDVHQGGQIFSHFLVALTDSFINTCSMSEQSAQDSVFSGIIDTLTLLGDLTSKGSDNTLTNSSANTDDQINLTQSNVNGNVSKLWTESVNPVNYRSFPQMLARYFLYNPPCTTFNQTSIEKLWDMYGLLLFKTFNDNLNGIVNGQNAQITKVNPLNRKRSVLIPKTHLKLTTQTDATKFYIFDGQKDMSDMITNLQTAGTIGQLSTNTPKDLAYNNNNGLISPGEVVGILPNMFNSSNSIMAGVQILSNDWDHAKLENGNLKPCNTFSDKWPVSTSAGAASASLTPTAPREGDCEYITKTNGSSIEELAPVCFVQQTTTNQTLWVDQRTFMKNNNLDSSKCLNPNNTKDCYMRAIKGAHQSVYSKINPNSNWAQSIAPNGSPSFHPSHLLLFEVNSWVPPGTTFECRFRARFTNCSDCYHDSRNINEDDFLDYEYSGGLPFVIIHYQFTVVN